MPQHITTLYEHTTEEWQAGGEEVEWQIQLWLLPWPLNGYHANSGEEDLVAATYISYAGQHHANSQGIWIHAATYRAHLGSAGTMEQESAGEGSIPAAVHELASEILRAIWTLHRHGIRIQSEPLEIGTQH